MLVVRDPSTKLSAWLLLSAMLASCTRYSEHWVLRQSGSADGGPGARRDGNTDLTTREGSTMGDGRATTDSMLDAGRWVTVAATTFDMGSPEEELCRVPWSSEETQHRVTLLRSFQMQRTEVTQRAFSELMGVNPSAQTGCDQCPVEQVSWHQAAAFCSALSAQEGRPSCYSCTGEGDELRCTIASSSRDRAIYDCPGYRLPTEAEWELAYRAGGSAATYAGNLNDCVADATVETIGWYEWNAADGPREVARKTPNAFGLYDLAGNVWEWCHDWHVDDLGEAAVIDPVGPESGSHRVTRGGSWVDDAGELRAAMRDSERPLTQLDYLGFRCVRSLGL